MTPYYQDDAVTLYHGDCREILPGLVADVLVTDPPYGVNLGDPDVGGKGRGGKHGLETSAYLTTVDTLEHLHRVVIPVVTQALAMTKRGAIFSGPHFQDFPKADALGGIYCPAGVGRHCWGFKLFHPVLLYGTDPRLHFGARPNVVQSNAPTESNGHPCPKPLRWMTWVVDLASLPDETVLDPFAGSGTTLRAAKDLGRRAIGVEIEERYCEIAARRLTQEVFAFSDKETV